MRDVFPGLIFLSELNVHVYLKMSAKYESSECLEGYKLMFLNKINHNLPYVKYNTYF
jgi:hypothetical protein